jgi:APA family basic amino acid/polyamine antiporter
MVIGTGIFVLPALVATHMGAAAILCYGICGVLIFLIALCFAEVGSKVTTDGGTYAYIEAAFGPFPGFLANNIFWISACLSDAAVANGLSKALGLFIPAIDTTYKPLFFFVLFGGLALINVRGAKNGVRMIVTLTLLKLVPLCLLVMFGVSHISADNLHWHNSFGFGDLGAATLLLFFAFLGIENAVANSGEFKNPSRVVPLGILSGLGIVLMLYIGIQLVAQGVLGDSMSLYKDAPLAEVSGRLFAKTGVVLISIGAAVSMLGGLSGSVLSVPRVLFAGARDGIFPKFLGSIHKGFSTPHRAIIVYAAIDFVISIFGALQQLILLSTASLLLIYLGVVLSTIQLRSKKIPSGEKGFIIPGGYIVPVLALIVICWLLTSLSLREMMGMILMLVLLTLLYVAMKFTRTKQQMLALKEQHSTEHAFDKQKQP